MPKHKQTESPVERILLRPPEAAEALGISVSKAYDLIKTEELPSIRLGGSLRVPVEALKEMVKTRRRGSP